MSALTVYASEGGARYHSTWKCAALHAGSLLSDHDCGYDTCTHDHPQMHPALDFTVAEVAECGKTPCRACLPPLAAAEDFGHEPMDVITNGKLRAVECYRCPVPWPCATAVVLGLPADETATFLARMREDGELAAQVAHPTTLVRPVAPH